MIVVTAPAKCHVAFELDPPVPCTLTAGHDGMHVGRPGAGRTLSWEDFPELVPVKSTATPGSVEDTDTPLAEGFQRSYNEVMADPERRKLVEDFVNEAETDGLSGPELLRAAAERAPAVLPRRIGTAVAEWLHAEAGCHEHTPGAAMALKGIMDNIADHAGEKAEHEVRAILSTLPHAEAVARAILTAEPSTVDTSARECLCGTEQGSDPWCSRHTSEDFSAFLQLRAEVKRLTEERDRFASQRDLAYAELRTYERARGSAPEDFLPQLLARWNETGMYGGVNTLLLAQLARQVVEAMGLQPKEARTT